MTTNPTPAGLNAEDTEYFLDAIRNLVDMGTSIARHVHTHITANPITTQAAAAEAVQTFNDIARSVRRAILLAQRITQPPEPQRPRSVQSEPEPRPQQEPREQADRGDRLDRLDRLDSPDRLDSITHLTHRPPAEAIAIIDRDLRRPLKGPANRWKRGARAAVELIRLEREFRGLDKPSSPLPSREPAADNDPTAPPKRPRQPLNPHPKTLYHQAPRPPPRGGAPPPLKKPHPPAKPKDPRRPPQPIHPPNQPLPPPKTQPNPAPNTQSKNQRGKRPCASPAAPPSPPS